MIVNTKYRALKIIINTVFIYLIFNTGIIGQTINGRFEIIEDSDSLYVGKIQVKLEEGSSVIGNAVVRYKFNSNRLSIPEIPTDGTDYQIYNFQNGNYISSVSHPSEDIISINIAKLYGDDISITNEYTDIAEITFNVIDQTKSKEFRSDLLQFFTPSSSEMWEFGSWIISDGETSFETPVQISPSDKAIDLESSVNIVWNRIETADLYHLQLSKEETFSTLDYENAELTDTNIVLDLEKGSEYYWRVRYSNTSGTSSFSKKYSFLTKAVEVPQVVLRSPLNDTTIIGTSAMFKWKSVSNRDFYQLQVATDSNFVNISKFIDTLHINEIEVNNLTSGQKHYWRARASIDNSFGKYSTIGKFFTAIVDTTKPSLLAPSNDEIDVNTTISFSWESIDSADYYQLEIAEDKNFDTIFYLNENIGSTEQTVYNFEKYTSYFWRVRFSNSSGNSMYSKVFTFETLAGNPTIPILLAPLPNSVDLDSDLTFTWKNDGVADHFMIEIYTDSGIQNPFYIEDSLKGTEITLDNFEQGKQYFWRVRSTNINGNSAFSAINKFRTRIGEPSILALIEPLNNSVGLDNTINFKWNPIDTALFYSIEIAEDSDFNIITISIDSIYSDHITVANLEEGIQYYWRLKSYNELGSNTISNISNFSTHVGSPNLPVAISPAPNSHIDSDVSFNWSPVENAVCYQLDIAQDRNFKNIVFSEDSLTSNKTTISDVGEGKNFYWRVKAINDYANSGFTKESKFIIKVNKPTNLASEIIYDQFVGLSWKDNSNVEKRFIIERSLKSDNSSDSYITIDTLLSNQTSYEDYTVEDNETYVYRVFSENSISISDYSNSTELQFSVDDNFDPNIPDEFALSQNYPNPFNPNTKINYSLKEMCDVGITIYNIIGEEVSRLVNDQQDAGNYTLEWDASNFASGVYLYVMKADSQESDEHFQAVNKMVLLK